MAVASITGILTVVDYDGETSNITLNFLDVDDALATFETAVGDLDAIQSSIAPLITGQWRSKKINATYPESTDAVTNSQAARELKWLVTCVDTTRYLGLLFTAPNPMYGKKFSFEIPTAWRAALDGNDNSDSLQLSDYGALVAAIEANVRSPWNHTAALTPTIEVLSIRCVGRNL